MQEEIKYTKPSLENASRFFFHPRGCRDWLEETNSCMNSSQSPVNNFIGTVATFDDYFKYVAYLSAILSGVLNN